MRLKPRILCIGLKPLIAIALRSLNPPGLEEAEWLMADNTDDLAIPEDKVTGFIVSETAFLSRLDYFLPRKNKVLILSSFHNSEKEIQGLSCVWEGASEKKIAQAIALKFSERESDVRCALSNREVEVLRLIANGKQVKEIADELCISVNTAATHRKNISAKLGIRSVSGLSLYALINGLI